MDAELLLEKIKNTGAVIYTESGLKEKLLSGKKLKIKLGADPSRPDLHLGHSVVLRMLRLMQDAGHEIVFVIGDFTGMVGDPTGRSKTRIPLTLEQTRENGKSYFEQVSKILDGEKTTIVYNSEWLGKMNFADVLGLAGKYTLARVIERDDFAKRYAKKAPIGLHELFYPLMQGYDSVAIHADVEVGGTDQTFNLIVGRELQRDYGQAPQEVITFPLLIGLDGFEKMSKSLDNAIGIDEAPADMFEKCMRIPDGILVDYFKMTTDIPEREYMALMLSDIRQAHLRYGREIVTMYHGEKAAELAEIRYHTVAEGGAPTEMPAVHIPAERLTEGNIKLRDLLLLSGLVSSNGEARRLITGRGVRVNAQTEEDPEKLITLADGVVLQAGKSRFVKVMAE